MRKTETKLALLLLTLILMLTCSLPPYDEGLSLGLVTAKKMVEMGAWHVRVGPITELHFDYQDREHMFIPNKGAVIDEFKSGFIATVDERYFDLYYVEYISPDSFELHFHWGTDITNDDPDRLNFHAETIKWGSFLSFTKFDANDYKNNRYFLIEVDTSVVPASWNVDEFPLRPYIHGDSPDYNPGVYDAASDKNPTVIGCSIWPRPSGDAFDDQVFLCRFDDNGLYGEIRYNTSTTSGLANPTVPPVSDDIVFSFPDYFENAFYYHNSNVNVSFLSYYSEIQRKYKNYSWPGPPDPPALKPLINMDRRIDAALTTGELLSFENNRCYVYDENGNKQFDFLLGGLHFCYEIELATLGSCVVFTLPGWLTLPHREDELYFSVYVFPTDRLSELQ